MSDTEKPVGENFDEHAAPKRKLTDADIDLREKIFKMAEDIIEGFYFRHSLVAEYDKLMAKTSLVFSTHMEIPVYADCSEQEQRAALASFLRKRPAEVQYFKEVADQIFLKESDTLKTKVLTDTRMNRFKNYIEKAAKYAVSTFEDDGQEKHYAASGIVQLTCAEVHNPRPASAKKNL